MLFMSVWPIPLVSALLPQRDTLFRVSLNISGEEGEGVGKVGCGFLLPVLSDSLILVPGT